jgi:hypothetical protein
MNNKFDELAKGLAQSVTRRQALKRFGAGLAGMALARFGLVGRAQAGKKDCACLTDTDCNSKSQCCTYFGTPGFCAPKGTCGGCGGTCTSKPCGTVLPTCAPNYSVCQGWCQFVLGC